MRGASEKSTKEQAQDTGETEWQKMSPVMWVEMDCTRSRTSN